MKELDIDNEDGLEPIEKQEKKKSRKIVVPSTAVPQYGSQRYYTKRYITIRRDGCVKFSAGLCQSLLRYNRDRILPLLDWDIQMDEKIWLLMDIERDGDSSDDSEAEDQGLDGIFGGTEVVEPMEEDPTPKRKVKPKRKKRLLNTYKKKLQHLWKRGVPFLHLMWLHWGPTGHSSNFPGPKN